MPQKRLSSHIQLLGLPYSFSQQQSRNHWNSCLHIVFLLLLLCERWTASHLSVHICLKTNLILICKKCIKSLFWKNPFGNSRNPNSQSVTSVTAKSSGKYKKHSFKDKEILTWKVSSYVIPDHVRSFLFVWFINIWTIAMQTSGKKVIVLIHFTTFN